MRIPPAPLLLLALAACPADGLGTTEIDYEALIKLDAVDDADLQAIVDAVDDDLVVIDDAKAVSIVTPEPGASVPADTAATFAWSVPTANQVVWLRLDGGGLSAPIDVVARDATSWTPDAATWALLAATTGPVQLTLTNAEVDGGVIVDGPYRSLNQPTTVTVTAGQ